MKEKTKRRNPRKAFLLCRGTVIGTGNKRLQEFIQVTIENGKMLERGSEIVFAKIRNTHVGSIYEAEVKIKDGQITTVFPYSFAFCLTHSQSLPNDIKAQLRLKSEANDVVLQVASQHKKFNGDKTAIFTTMAPFRAAYKRTNTMGKLAMEVRLLHYLRYGDD